MKPELLSAEARTALVLQEMKNSGFCPEKRGDVYWLAERVAKGALEELHVGRVVDVHMDDEYQPWPCPYKMPKVGCQHPNRRSSSCPNVKDERPCPLVWEGALLLRPVK